MTPVILYYLLCSISMIGDSIFIYYVGISFLEKEGGGLICSMVMGLDAFFEIALGPYLARFIDAIPSIQNRLKYSPSIHAISSLIAFFPLLVIHFVDTSLVLLIIILGLMRFFGLIDRLLKAALPFYLDKNRKVPLIQSLSLSLFSQRCIFLVSSSLAPVMLGASWFFACSLNSISYLFALFAPFIITKALISSPSLKSSSSQSDFYQEPPIVEMEEEKKKWINWSYAATFLTNIVFGSVAMILTKSMLSVKNESLILQILEGPAPMYAGLLVALVLLIIHPHKGNPFAKNAKRICLNFSSVGLGLIVLSLSHSSLHAIILFFLGIFNGFSLVAFDTFGRRQMEGKNFVRSSAKWQALSQLGLLISLFVAGFCIDLGYGVMTLLAISGSSALVISLGLFLGALFFENSFKKSIKKALPQVVE